MDKSDIDRTLREMGVSGGIEEFRTEAAQWAKEAEQCKCCQAWAKLDESGHCSACRDKV